MRVAEVDSVRDADNGIRVHGREGSQELVPVVQPEEGVEVHGDYVGVLDSGVLHIGCSDSQADHLISVP